MQENPQGPLGYGQTGSPIPTPGGIPVQPYSGVNDSGTGATAVLPPELQGFNWGALLMNWIWSIAHNSWIGLIALVPYVGFVMAIVLGFKGNEWAWQNRKWDSVEHFRATQKVWTKWGVGILIFGLVVGIGSTIMAASMMKNMPASSTTTTTIPAQ